jgi:Alpha-lytic protease prodomain
VARRTWRMSVLIAVSGAALVLLPTIAAAHSSQVARGVGSLNGIVEALNRHGGPPGTAWGVDEVAGQVVVFVEAGAAAGPTRALLRYAAGLDGAVRVMMLLAEAETVGTVAADSLVAVTTLRAGDGIYAVGLGGSTLCSAGFPVITGSPLPPPPYAPNRVLTSGQCSSTYPSWYVGGATGPYLGSTDASLFPGTDYGVIAKSAGVPAVSAVNLYNGTSRPIYSSGDPYLNRSVCVSGVGSGYRCGKVTATNITANYGSGGVNLTVHGLAAVNICTKNSDRGGPVFDGNTAVGLISKSVVCGLSPITYVQPVRPAMHASNLFFPPA